MAVAYNPSIVQSGLILCLDAANKKSYSQNEFRYSTDIFAFSGSSANASTISRDTISSPVGNTPLKMSVTGNDPYWNAYNSPTYNIAPAVNGQTWVVSVYVKASVATSGQIFIFNADSNGSAFANNNYGATGISITTEWTRVQYNWTMNSVNTAYIHVRLDGPDSGGNGQTIWWDGLQVERVSSGVTSPTPYTSSYYGGNIFKDLSGRNNTGTLSNYPIYTSSNNGSLIFDGTDDRVDLSTAVGTVSGYTIGYWAKRDAESRMPVSTISADFYWFGDNSWRYVHGGVGGEFYYSKPTSIPLGTWGYYAVTYDGSNVSVYRQGIYQGQQASTGTANFSSALRIGWWGSNAYAYLGNISQVSMYNRALTQAEITKNFNAARGRYGL
jgi:hypothetical protein